MTTPTKVPDQASAGSGPDTWRPHREPIAQALTRTFTITLVAGGVVTMMWRRPEPSGLARWMVVSLLALWPAFGGHWVELCFLNGLRPRLPRSRAVQMTARLAVWFIGGIMLMLGVCLTTKAVVGFSPARWPAWWFGGIAFIGIELFVHVIFLLLGRPCFYDGRG